MRALRANRAREFAVPCVRARTRVRVCVYRCLGLSPCDYRPPNVLARRGELSARRLAPGGRWD